MPKETEMYITSFEKEAEERGHEKGLVEGREEAIEETIFKFVEAKFGSMSDELREAIANLDMDQLNNIVPSVYLVGTVDEIWTLIS